MLSSLSFTLALIAAFLALSQARHGHDKNNNNEIMKQGLRKKKEPSASINHNCFLGVNTVQVCGKGTIAMKDLQVGDMVKDMDGNMVAVYGFGPYQPNTKAEFLQFHAKGSSNNMPPLEISKGHLVFVSGGHAIPALMVRVGDMLDIMGPGKQQQQGGVVVDKIKTVVRTGTYTPFTTSGTIMVSAIAASSYVTPQKDSKVLVVGGYQYPTILSMHWLAHMFHALPWMACLSCANYCKSDKVTLSKWVAGTLHVGKWLMDEENSVVATVAFLPLLLLGMLVYFIETVFVVGNVFALAILGAVVVMFYSLRKVSLTKKLKSKVA